MALTTPVQTYFIPIREEDLIIPGDAEGDFEILSGSSNTDKNDLFSIIGVSVATENTIIYYDHWEDGYDVNPANPGSTTIVLGDGDLSNNGSLGALDADGDDIFDAGETFTLINEIDQDRQGNPNIILFDGSDKISATFPISVTRAAFAENPGTPLAGATEVFDTSRFGTSFELPIGIDTPEFDSGGDNTSFVAAHVQAGEGGTVVRLNGTVVTTLSEGDSIVLRDLSEGDEITTSNPSQVHLATGDEGDTYELRWFALQPTEAWSNDYYTPTFTGENTASNGDEDSVSGSGPTQVLVYNPGDSDITVKYDFAGGGSPDGSFTVAAGETAFSPIIPDDSGARFFTDDANDIFYALSITDTSGIGNRNDWGHPLIPADQLTSQALVAIGFGNSTQITGNGSADSRSVVWVTPLEEADIFVDFGDGNGLQLFKQNADALSSVKIEDTSDNDMSGARIIALDDDGNPVRIAVSYGQDSAQSGSGSNFEGSSIDFGTVIPALPETTITKSADVDQTSTGGFITYTIQVQNTGAVTLPANSLRITDLFDDSELDYIANTTVYDPTPDNSNSGDEVTLTDDNTGTAFPLDGTGFINTVALAPGDVQTLTFQVQVDDFADITSGTTEVVNDVTLSNVNGGILARDSVTTPIIYDAGIDIEKSTNGQDADTQNGAPRVNVGETVTWTYTITNTGETFLKEIKVSDDQIDDNDITFVGGDTNDNGLLDTDETWIYTATGTAEAGAYTNTGTVEGRAVWEDRRHIPEENGGGIVTDEDPSNYFGVNNGSIAGRLFEDDNANGIDNNDDGISGTTVTLLDGNGNTVATTTTDGNGDYLFEDLPADNYRVVFDRPNGFDGTSPQDVGNNDAIDSDGDDNLRTDVFTLAAGENKTDVDQGVFKLATIGDFVFADTDGDGIQDAGEDGIEGVTVRLRDGNTIIETTTTDADGNYAFTVDPGTYQVEFVKPNGTVFSPANQGGDDAADSDAANNGRTGNITVASGETDNTNDAGIIVPATIRGTLFEDTNADGQEDGVGIPGEMVMLLDGNGNTVATTTTDANGDYEFTGVLPGDYQVSFDRPSGFTGTSPQNVGNDATDSDGNTNLVIPTFSVESGDTVENLDQGVFRQATIGDLVFEDTDGDGIQDAGEDGIEGVTVRLRDGNTIIETVTTDADGNYEFTVDPGTYQVEFVKPDGSVFSPANQGGDDAADSDAGANGLTADITVASGETDNTNDAGIIGSQTLSGTVFEDVNADGQEDGEPIEGATVILRDNNGDEVGRTTTDANGDYTFTVLPGDYTVDFEQPGGFPGVSPQNVGDDATDSDGDPTNQRVSVTVPAGQDVTNVDQGYFQQATIGDFVFTDTNGDGIQDDGEPGREGVTVNLLDENGTQIVTTTTGADGEYSFTVDPGTYSVEVEGPDGTFFSPQDQGNNDADDSDVDDAGQTGPITVESGEVNNTIDAGLIDEAPAIGLVKKVTAVDASGDGVLNAAGEVIEYTLTVTNEGNIALDNVTIKDPLTGLDQNIGTLGVGQSQAITTSYTLKQSDLDTNGGGDGDIDNIATADSDQTDPVDDDAEVPVELNPGLEFDKSVVTPDRDNGDDRANNPGDVIVYSLAVTNTGNVTLTNVTVVDPLTNTSEIIPSIAPGATETVTAEYTVTQADLDGAGNAGQDFDIDNVATADSDQTDPVDDDAEVPLGDPELDIFKVICGVDKDGNGVIDNVNEEIDYQLIVKNAGTALLTNVVVTDPLTGVDTNLGTLKPGEVRTIETTYQVTAADFDSNGTLEPDNILPGFIDNVARADSDQTDEVSDDALVKIVTNPDLALDKAVVAVDAAGDGLANAVGDIIEYTLTVTNTGNVTLTNVTVTDPLTGFNQVIATLAAGESKVFDTEYAVTQEDISTNGGGDGDIDNTATADSDQTDEVTDTEEVDLVIKCTDIEDHFDRPDSSSATIQVGQGHGHKNGTNGDDIIFADNTNNYVSTNEGNNVVVAMGGDDVINGGNQTDLVFGDAGNDIINGNAGDDFLSGGKGDDKIYGASGNDKILAGDGDDLVEAGAGDDIINLGAGNDTVQGEGGYDCIAGGKDDGKITGNGDTVNVKLGDELFGNGGADTFEYCDGDGVDFLFDFKAEDGDVLKLYGLDEGDAKFVEGNTPYGPAAGIVFDKDGDGKFEGGVFFQQVRNPDELEQMVDNGTIQFI